MNDKRNVVLSTKVTLEEALAIREIASVGKMSVSDLIRSLLLDAISLGNILAGKLWDDSYLAEGLEDSSECGSYDRS